MAVSPLEFRVDEAQRLRLVLGDVDDNDTLSLARWIRSEVAPELPQLDRVDLYETRGCGVVVSWGELAPALPV